MTMFEIVADIADSAYHALVLLMISAALASAIYLHRNPIKRKSR